MAMVDTAAHGGDFDFTIRGYNLGVLRHKPTLPSNPSIHPDVRTNLRQRRHYTAREMENDQNLHIILTRRCMRLER